MNGLRQQERHDRLPALERETPGSARRTERPHWEPPGSRRPKRSGAGRDGIRVGLGKVRSALNATRGRRDRAPGRRQHVVRHRRSRRVADRAADPAGGARDECCPTVAHRSAPRRARGRQPGVRQRRCRRRSHQRGGAVGEERRQTPRRPRECTALARRRAARRRRSRRARRWTLRASPGRGYAGLVVEAPRTRPSSAPRCPSRTCSDGARSPRSIWDRYGFEIPASCANWRIESSASSRC